VTEPARDSRTAAVSDHRWLVLVIVAISTVVLTAAANYLSAHPAGALAQVTAATHGYTTGFAVSAVVLAAAALVTFTVLPAKRELAQRQSQSQPVTSAPAATSAALAGRADISRVPQAQTRTSRARKRA
jgi:hypothetical protein